MTLRGKIKNGKVVFDNPGELPDGTEVIVRAIKRKAKPSKKPKAKGRPRSLADRLRPFIGILNDLPPDMSVNLDHYLYGLPKRKKA